MIHRLTFHKLDNGLKYVEDHVYISPETRQALWDGTYHAGWPTGVNYYTLKSSYSSSPWVRIETTQMMPIYVTPAHLSAVNLQRALQRMSTPLRIRTVDRYGNTLDDGDDGETLTQAYICVY